MSVVSNFGRVYRALRSDMRSIVRDLLLNKIGSSQLMLRRFRPLYLGIFGHQISRSSSIAPGCFLGDWSGLSVGAGAYINYGCFFDLGAQVSIGSRAFVGYQVLFCTCSHGIGSAEQRAGVPTVSPILVGDGAWVGARTVLLPGSVIGRGTIIAAGSVVTGICKDNALYAGTPARLVRDL